MNASSRKPPAAGSEETVHLQLYVAGQTPNSVRAIANLQSICEVHLQGRYEVQVIDLYQQPHLAQGEQIVAIPTLVRRLPPPLRRIIGDLSNTERVLVGLDIKRVPAASGGSRSKRE